MFTGIVENLGLVKDVSTNDSNVELTIQAPLNGSLYVDQSISHNGVCLTITELLKNEKKGPKLYKVTLIQESLNRTNFKEIKIGDTVNLERCLKTGDRLDGHFVQGHVDGVGQIKKITDMEGSWVFEIEYPLASYKLVVEKGSICINGVSLTVVEDNPGLLSIAIIPYTYENTSFKFLRNGDKVNMEFDILGKYLQKSILIAGKDTSA